MSKILVNCLVICQAMDYYLQLLSVFLLVYFCLAETQFTSGKNFPFYQIKLVIHHQGTSVWFLLPIHFLDTFLS